MPSNVNRGGFSSGNPARPSLLFTDPAFAVDDTSPATPWVNLDGVEKVGFFFRNTAGNQITSMYFEFSGLPDGLGEIWYTSGLAIAVGPGAKHYIEDFSVWANRNQVLLSRLPTGGSIRAHLACAGGNNALAVVEFWGKMRI